MGKTLEELDNLYPDVPVILDQTGSQAVIQVGHFTYKYLRLADDRYHIGEVEESRVEGKEGDEPVVYVSRKYLYDAEGRCVIMFLGNEHMFFRKYEFQYEGEDLCPSRTQPVDL